MREAESPSNASADLASFLTALANRIEAVNPALLRQADDALLDTLGCIVFGADQPWTKAAHRHALATGGDGRCTVVGADRVNLANVIYVGGGSTGSTGPVEEFIGGDSIAETSLLGNPWDPRVGDPAELYDPRRQQTQQRQSSTPRR